MKKHIKKLVMLIVIPIILSMISSAIMYKKWDDTSQETLLKYVSSKKSDKEGFDLIETYIAVAQGYESGDNVVGADVARIMSNTFITNAVIVLVISFILMLIAVYMNKAIIYCFGLLIIFSSIYLLPSYEIDFKYKKSYESIDNDIEYIYNKLSSSGDLSDDSTGSDYNESSYNNDSNLDDTPSDENNDSNDPLEGIYDPELDDFKHLRVLPHNKERVYNVICGVESTIEGLSIQDIDIIPEIEMINGSVSSIDGVINLKANLSIDDIFIMSGNEDKIGTDLKDIPFLYSDILSYVRNIRQGLYDHNMSNIHKIAMFDVNGVLIYEENISSDY